MNLHTSLTQRHYSDLTSGSDNSLYREGSDLGPHMALNGHSSLFFFSQKTLFSPCSPSWPYHFRWCRLDSGVLIDTEVSLLNRAKKYLYINTHTCPCICIYFYSYLYILNIAIPLIAIQHHRVTLVFFLYCL